MAAIGVGTPTDHLETKVTTLTARATSGGIYLTETDGFIVDDVAITIQEVQADSTLVARTDATQSDVLTTAGNGNIVLQTLTGSITLNDGTASADNIVVSADGTGNLLIEAADAAGDITANADLLSGTGHITVLAGHDLTFASTADVITSAAGTLNLVAGTGSLTQPDNSRFVTTTGDIRLVAQVDILLGGLTTTGNASLTATTGSILDSGDAFGGEDVIANGLHLFAARASACPPTTRNPRYHAHRRATSGGIYLTETDALIVDDVAVTIQRVNADATVTAVTDATQSDVATTAGNGGIVLQTLAGDITLNDGTAAADNTAVSAHGTGNILLEALAAGTNITITPT